MKMSESKKIDPEKFKKKKLLLLQNLEELHKNANELWKTVSKQSTLGPVDFNYFFKKYNDYLAMGRKYYGKKMNEFTISISDTEYKQVTGLKKIITEIGLLIIFIKNDIGNIVDENLRLKKLLAKYKSQVKSINKIT